MKLNQKRKAYIGYVLAVNKLRGLELGSEEWLALKPANCVSITVHPETYNVLTTYQCGRFYLSKRPDFSHKYYWDNQIVLWYLPKTVPLKVLLNKY